MRTRYLPVMFLVPALSLIFATAPAIAAKAGPAMSVKSVQLQDAMRDLWIGHIFWVRSVVMSSKCGDAEAVKAAETSAVENARAIAASVVPFYGKAAGDKLFELLAGHYGAVKAYMTAAYARDKGGMENARAAIMTNGDAIAVFLSSANPNWPKETLQTLLMSHGAHHIDQIQSFANGDFSSEAVVWGSMKNHMYTIADALAAGIAKQFPKKV